MKTHIITTLAILGAVLSPIRAQQPPPGTPQDAKPFNGKWYLDYVESRGFTWKQAQERCRELGGQLACVPNAATQEFLETIIGNRGAMEFWLGATNKTSTGKWMWCDGSEMEFSYFMGAPQHIPPESDLAISGTHQWHAVRENRQISAFICEWPASKAPTTALRAVPTKPQSPPEPAADTPTKVAQIQPAPSATPETIAQRIVDTYFLTQAEAMLTKAGENLYELRKAKPNIETQALTETDRLNGFESRVEFVIEFSHYRIKDLRTKQWSDWKSASAENDWEQMQILGLPVFYQFVKRHGQWSVGRQNPLGPVLEAFGGSAIDPIQLEKPTPEEISSASGKAKNTAYVLPGAVAWKEILTGDKIGRHPVVTVVLLNGNRWRKETMYYSTAGTRVEVFDGAVLTSSNANAKRPALDPRVTTQQILDGIGRRTPDSSEERNGQPCWHYTVNGKENGQTFQFWISKKTRFLVAIEDKEPGGSRSDTSYELLSLAVEKENEKLFEAASTSPLFSELLTK